MSYVSKVISLGIALLLVAGGIGHATYHWVDLVPWAGGEKGHIGITKVSCVHTQQAKVLTLKLGIKNQGGAPTTLAVKTLVKVDGAVWISPDNPHTTPAGMSSGQWEDFYMTGPAPGLGTHTLWVKVDSDKVEGEPFQEGNNEITVTMICERLALRPTPKLYPKPKVGPPPVEQQNVPQR